MADPIRMACQFKKPSDRDLTHKAYEIRCIPPPNLPRINFEHHWVNDIPIHDIRDIQGQLSLDVQGFIVGVLPSQMPYEDFFEQKKLQAGYAEQLREYLLEILGAQCVYFHECVIRKASEMGKKQSQSGFGEPVRRAHGDYSLGEITKLLGELGGETLQHKLKDRRYQALNIWKPLKGPVMDWPLALCDLQSVDTGDMVPLDEVYNDDVLESYVVHYNEKQRWYYLSRQTTEEILIFKSADSLIMGTVPHTSFNNSDKFGEDFERESMEFRALVIY